MSPIKAAAQERIVRQNTELAEFVSKLNEEKKELRVALGNLEEQIAQYRQRERANEEVSCTGKLVTHLQSFFSSTAHPRDPGATRGERRKLDCLTVLDNHVKE